MSERAALLDLAQRLGIAARYTDALGETREVCEETLRALVAAFGLPPEPAAARQALVERERAMPFGLDPVQLIDAEDAQPRLLLRLPAVPREIAWICRLETGEARSGAVTGTALAPDSAGRIALPLPGGLPLGYHRLDIAAAGLAAQLRLVVVPPACYLPPALGPGARSWGLTCQLYALKSAGNWGMGDFSDLAQLARATGASGAAALGVNPLHALFAAEPLHISPYSPSSRVWLNPLYLDVTAVPGFAEDAAVREMRGQHWFTATHWAARSAELIDYGAVAALKLPVLEALFRRFAARELGANGAAHGTLGAAFRTFQRDGGEALARFAVFEALHEHFRHEGRGFSWRGWPEPMRDPHAPAVAAFAAEHRERVEFFQFLQWQADCQLASAAAAGRDAGLSIGLYRDLAVGADPNGAAAWADQELIAPGAAIGAPPDALSRSGQNWGLAPVNPVVMQARGYAPFLASLRANMRHAGLLRIDHVMALRRLYWVPSGMPASAGAYVRYPFDDLVRLVALESHRHRCAVIGEDLGTVPDGFRERMRAANLLSYRIAAFERRADGAFAPPADYPALAAACAASHDIPTLKGFWLGTDIAWRRRLGLYPDEGTGAAEAAERARDRRLLLEALAEEGVLPRQRFGEFLPADGEPHYEPALGEAILAFLARSRARLMLVQLEDVTGEGEQANLPGTTDAHPNWRLRVSRTLEEIAESGALGRVAALVGEARSRSSRG